MLWIILAVLLAAVLYVLHYGYKLAFYYEDPQESPYLYEKNDQKNRNLSVYFLSCMGGRNHWGPGAAE